MEKEIYEQDFETIMSVIVVSCVNVCDLCINL